MHRSGWITGAIVGQALWAAFLISLAIFLLDLTRAASAEVSAGLKTTATFLIVSAVLACTSWYGLWKATLWGWWLAVMVDLAVLAMFVYSIVDDGLRNIDWHMAAMTVTSAVVPVFLLIPAVRRFFWNATKATI
jgi:uncharacterized membrane protein (DUF2068 family)